MKIAICDNDIHFCEEIERMIAGYGEIQKRRIETLVFYSGESLCTYLEQCEEIDILFLDIEFEQMSGIDVGEHIRKHLGNDVPKNILVVLKSNIVKCHIMTK